MFTLSELVMTIFIRSRAFVWVFLLSLAAAMPSRAAEKVNVVGYHFPPFVDDYGGVTPKLIDGLNALQSRYVFHFTKTSPARRYRDLQTGRGDLIFFEMPRWGWAESSVSIETTREILSGKEVYLALNKPGRDQSYFKDIRSKRIAAISGYHYGFADYNANPRWLKSNFNISLTQNHTTNIRVLRAEHVDLSIVNISYLQKFLKENESLRSKLLISERKDQDYHLKAIMRKNGPIGPSELESLLQLAKDKGLMDQILAFYGIQQQLSF